ncbi:MAG: 23S rRNA (adenine(2503)-C(2))-methyltransferase RlmN [Spirochaetales bacterium]|nr:23S rRNA (adenine(2503)-C(2))-methyltransferase RlmN [Spirochaetales bacterium]
MKQSLIGLMPEDISNLLKDYPGFRAKQIFEHIYSGKKTFSQMSNLPKDLRAYLDDNFSLYNSEVVEIQKSIDGTEKFLIRLYDNNLIEAVILKDEERLTACLSTQIGCAMGCSFCKTSELGLVRDLDSSEILQEFLHLIEVNGKISNIVFMGMGEPLANYSNLSIAIRVLTHEKGLGLGRRKITVSTCGLVPKMRRLAEDFPQVKLAVSLNSCDNSKRSEIMPVNKRYNLEELKNAIKEFNDLTGKRVTAEYVLLKDENDSSGDISKIVRFASGLNLLINVIPWNSKDNSAHKSPSRRDVEKFMHSLESAGLKVTRRQSKGSDIDGACGQLAAKSRKN